MRNRIVRPEQKKRMPVIGKIKVGEKVEKNGKEYPVSLDYFVADGNYKHIFDKKFEKPQKLDIVFISDDPAECCVERLEIRQGQKLYARGDGYIFEVYDKKTDQYVIRTIEEEPDLIEKVQKECNSNLPKNKKPSEFDEILTLYFLVLGINEVFGVWKFQTKGKDSSIPSIVSSFDKVLETAGRIKFIPFTLSVEKVKSQKPDSKNLFPVVSLVANIGQEYMEKLQDHIMSGTNISGILTEERIENATQQIEYEAPPGVELEFSIVPKFKEMIDKCQELDKMKEIAQEINSLHLPDNHKDELRQCYVKRLKELDAQNRVSTMQGKPEEENKSEKS